MRNHFPTPPLLKAARPLLLQLCKQEQTTAMAMWKAFVAGSVRLLMVSVGLAFALLYIAGTIITHPLTALRKKKRDSECSLAK